MNYQRDMRIDDTALDVEWLDQAELALKYGRHWSNCYDELKRAEEKVKYVRSKLILEINKNPDKYLGEGIKPTDPKVEAAYRTNDEFLEAKEEWLVALKKANDAEIAKNEIAFTRKSALENMVILNGQNYFAGPKVPRDLAKVRIDFEKQREKSRTELNKKVRIRKSKVN
jgi:hypothetical protein